MPPVSRWLQRHPVAAYVGLAFGITWLAVAPLVAQAQGWLAGPIPPLWHTLGAGGPLLAALWVTRATGGDAAALLARLGRWRIGAGWLAVALLSPLLLFALAALGLRLVGGAWPSIAGNALSWGWLGRTLLVSLAYGVGEEVGWRGVALPRLQRGRSALRATFLLSVVWALWHLPMFFYRFEFGPAQVMGFFIALFAGAIWLTFLYNSSGGSLVAVAAWHTVWNIVNIGGLALSDTLVAGMSALVMVAAPIIVWRGGPNRLSLGSKQVIPASGER